MRILRYKRKWRAQETIRAALARGILVSWYNTTNGEVAVVLRRE